MAAAPRALLLLGVLLAVFLLLSSHVTDAAQRKQTQETKTEAAGENVVDSKQAACPRCCRWFRHGFGVRCVRCCADGEEAPSEVENVVDDNKQECPRGYCCRRHKSGGRCAICCVAGEKAVEEIPVDDVEAEEPHN